MDQVLETGRPQLKYVQVRDYVRSVCVGAAPGTPAPSERELVNRFGVARMTVRQAIDTLVAEGTLERVRGRGTFVSRPRRRVGDLTSFTEEMRRRGLEPDSETLLAEHEAATGGVARALGLTAGDPVIHWRRLRLGSGAPVAIEDAYLNELLLPGFLLGGLPTSLYDALAARGLRPTLAEDSVAADVADATEAALLDVRVGAPVLRVSRRGLAAERPVVVARSVYRADRFTLWLHLGESD